MLSLSPWFGVIAIPGLPATIPVAGISDPDEGSIPILGLKTKFGGQPCWLLQPEWPLSRSTKQPLTFIGQIALTEALFGELDGRMAYLFINSEDFENSWDPDGGENAVAIQPGEDNSHLETVELATGPSAEFNYEFDAPEFDVRLTDAFELKLIQKILLVPTNSVAIHCVSNQRPSRLKTQS